MDDLIERLEKEAWAADHDSPGRHKWANLFREAKARIATLEALVKEAQPFMRHGPYCDTSNLSYTGHDTAMMGKFPCTCGLAKVSARIKENSRD